MLSPHHYPRIRFQSSVLSTERNSSMTSPVNSSYVISCNISIHYDNKNRKFFFIFDYLYIKIYNNKYAYSYVLFFHFFKSIFNQIFLNKCKLLKLAISLKFYEIIIIVQLSSIYCFIYK